MLRPRLRGVLALSLSSVLVVTGCVSPADGPQQATVVPGKAFDLEEWAFASGWSVVLSGGKIDVEGLRAENTGDDPQRVLLDLHLQRHGHDTAVTGCSSDDDIARGKSGDVTCVAYPAPDAGYDRVELILDI